LQQAEPKDLNHTKQKPLRASGKGATARCLVCENKTVFVGKLEFIRENHEVREAENC
jgi:hypothetical protein